MTRTDEALHVLRAQSGDRAAVDALFQHVQAPLFRCIEGIVGRRELAEDVLQEVFLILYRKLAWLREPKLFRPWAYRIASREAVRAARRRYHLVHDEEALDSLPDPSTPDPITSQMAARLPELVAHVPPASRAVLTLYYLEEMRLPEVAAVLGVSLGTVKSRLAYGLAKLRLEFDVKPTRRKR